MPNWRKPTAQGDEKSITLVKRANWRGRLLNYYHIDGFAVQLSIIRGMAISFTSATPTRQLSLKIHCSFTTHSNRTGNTPGSDFRFLAARRYIACTEIGARL
jgi:hypothetical protein